MKKLIYVASPYTAETEEERLNNVHRQIHAGEQISRMGADAYLPLLSHYWDAMYPHSWKFWIDMCKNMVPRCDGLIRLSGKSDGAEIEKDLALGMSIPVFYAFEELEEWLKINAPNT